MLKNMEISKAKQLASILKGNANTSVKTATVQRSHRFPIYEFILIENMAKMADCSVSAMINQVLSVGVDALYEHLDRDLIQQMHATTQAQVDKANSNINQKVGKSSKK